MNLEEKLVELLDNFHRDFSPYAKNEKMFVVDDNIEQAEYLIAHGVTIQKWNHVSITPKDGLYIVKLKDGKKLPARHNCGSWIMCEGYKNITNEVNEWREIE